MAALPPTERLGERLPSIRTAPPGPRSRELAERLARVESRDVTSVGALGPIFWQAAKGSNVLDVDGNVYLDLCGAFGVAISGHRPDAVERAVADQQRRLVHGMGDVHPPEAKVELLERLTALGPWPSARAVLASSGSEAVEIALKTALLHTGKPGVLAFEGAYHGLTHGALATTHRAHFRAPFTQRLYDGVSFVPFPEARATGLDASRDVLRAVEDAFRDGAPNGDPIGALIVEPVQGRAGVRVPPAGFLAEVSALSARHGVVIVADEVFTGLGRCGEPLVHRSLGLRADLACLGKALGGGYPLSACVGSSEVFEAWPESTGEAVHTSTFLGHPVACAAASALLDAVRDGELCQRATTLGDRAVRYLRAELEGVEHVGDVRGLGLLIGIELVKPESGRDPEPAAAVRVSAEALARGVIVLPAGECGHVVELAPPATMSWELLAHGLDVVVQAVRARGA